MHPRCRERSLAVSSYQVLCCFWSKWTFLCNWLTKHIQPNPTKSSRISQQLMRTGDLMSVTWVSVHVTISISFNVFEFKTILTQFNNWNKVHLKRYGMQIGGEGIEKLLCSWKCCSNFLKLWKDRDPKNNLSMPLSLEIIWTDFNLQLYKWQLLKKMTYET